jgi:hypothetical protein
LSAADNGLKDCFQTEPFRNLSATFLLPFAPRFPHSNAIGFRYQSIGAVFRRTPFGHLSDTAIFTQKHLIVSIQFYYTFHGGFHAGNSIESK